MDFLTTPMDDTSAALLHAKTVSHSTANDIERLAISGKVRLKESDTVRINKG